HTPLTTLFPSTTLFRSIRHNPHPHAHVRPASPTHAHDAAVPAYGYLENSNLERGEQMGANRTPVEQVRLGVLNELVGFHIRRAADRKSTRLNSSHVKSS